jgi:uncharacterized protein
MLATLWVTTACNMRCLYCYEGDNKPNNKMDKVMADKSIEYILKQFKELNDDDLIINFHGGEPLLEFQLIKYIVKRLKNTFMDSKKKLFLGATTNGILLDDEIIEYICDNFYYNLSISLDGDKVIHDTNRILKDGRGSYNLIINSCKKILNKRDDVRVRMTYNTLTVDKLYESVKFLVNLGFNIIVPVADYYDEKWNQELIDVLNLEAEKIYNLYKRESKKNKKLRISMVGEEVFKKGICTGGINTYNIFVNGDIYPCTYVIENQDFNIGHVTTGINKVKLSSIHNMLKTKNEICDGCNYYNCCYATRCKFINRSITGNLNTPSPVMCAVENILYKYSKV